MHQTVSVTPPLPHVRLPHGPLPHVRLPHGPLPHGSAHRRTARARQTAEHTCLQSAPQLKILSDHAAPDVRVLREAQTALGSRPGAAPGTRTGMEALTRGKAREAGR